MQTRLDEHERQWRQAIWKVLTNPAFEVIATIVVVLLATWVLVGTEAFQDRRAHMPVLFGHK
jgi:hypothetical protein